jgi:hypothetical protein
MRLALALCGLLIGLTGTGAAAAEAVGQVVLLHGSAARHTPDGASHALAAGDPVFEDDRLETGERSLLSIEFTDETRFNLGPRAIFRIDRVRTEGEGVFSAEVLKGAFRFVTGLIAKQRARAMQVKTGVVATIGIRGTTVGGEVEGESATIVLLEPEGVATASAIEVGNAFGSVVIDQPGYGTRVPDAHSPPSPPARMSLRAIENLSRTISNMQRQAVPRPSFR